jgi:hypothetical protein
MFHHNGKKERQDAPRNHEAYLLRLEIVHGVVLYNKPTILPVLNDMSYANRSSECVLKVVIQLIQADEEKAREDE